MPGCPGAGFPSIGTVGTSLGVKDSWPPAAGSFNPLSPPVRYIIHSVCPRSLYP